MSKNQESCVRREEEEGGDEKSLKVWDCGSPLYDAYELVAVSHLVERHFMILPYLSGSRNIARTDEYLSEEEKRGVETTSEKASVLGFLRRNVWKRKMGGGDGKEKEKEKKAKRQRVISGISKIFAWKK